MKTYKNVSSAIIMGVFLLSLPALPTEIFGQKKLNVVTTTSDMAYFAKRIGGDRVQVRSLIRGTEDPHYVSARPDFIVALNRADVFIEVGLEMEVGWSPVLIRESRNPRIQTNANGYCDASLGIRVLERPSTISRSGGDIHAFGNPHYWLDPFNAALAARNIRDAFIRVDPTAANIYFAAYKKLTGDLKRLTVDELKKFQNYRGIKLAVYHKEFSYLQNRFKFKIVLTIEEKPGVPPSARYLRKVIDRMKKEKVKIILVAPFNNQRYARRVAQAVGAKVLVMPISVNSISGVNTYEKTITNMMAQIRAAAGL